MTQQPKETCQRTCRGQKSSVLCNMWFKNCSIDRGQCSVTYCSVTLKKNSTNKFRRILPTSGSCIFSPNNRQNNVSPVYRDLREFSMSSTINLPKARWIIGIVTRPSRWSNGSRRTREFYCFLRTSIRQCTYDIELNIMFDTTVSK